jgi:hypothetical protein
MSAQLQQEHLNSSSRSDQVIRNEIINSQHFQTPFETINQYNSTKIQAKTIQIQKIEDNPDSVDSQYSLMVFICSPDNKSRKVSVIPSDPLYVVNPIFPGYKKVYFYNGEILDPNQSFNYYGITNDDRIATVPIEQMNINTELFWIKATKNSANDKKRFIGTSDEATKHLFEKNNDLILFKAESRANSNRRLLKNLMF